MPSKTKEDPLIRQIKKLSLKKSRDLEKRPIPKPLPKASPELWPGEHMELGGFTLAKSKRKKRLLERIGYG